MKNTALIISIISIIAIIYLYIDKFSGKQSVPVEQASAKDSVETPTNINIAFIKIDSLLMHYDFYNELEDKLKKKKANLEAQLDKKASKLEQEFANFQKKEQTGAFVSQESYQRQAEELMRKREDLMNSEQALTQQLYTEGAEMEKQIFDSIINFVKEFNKEKKYTYILNGGNLLYGDSGLDITDTILTMLNERYNKQKQNSETK